MNTQGTKRGVQDDASTSPNMSTQKNKRHRPITGERGHEGTMRKAKLIMTEVQNKLKTVLCSKTNMELIDYIREKIADLETNSKKKITVGVFGRTGAGKSSLINTILGEKELLPSGSVCACTSVIIQVEANTTDSSYTAEIEFISKQDWEQELTSLLGVLSEDNEETDDEINAANDKIRALYGEDGIGKSFDELMEDKHFTDIPEFLSSTKKTVSFKAASELSTEISCYIQTNEESPGGLYWPIVKTVTIKLPNCKDFLRHIVLVDLPGAGDFNKSRDEMWKTCLRRCSTVWIVSEINRAASDKEAWNILTSNIKDLGPGGECSSITFICTKTDDINPENHMRSCKLKDEDLHLTERKDSTEYLENKKRACILHRNSQAKIQVRKVFNRQIEIQKQFSGGEDVLQVLTVSAEEYPMETPKLNMILKPEETEIPKLKELLWEINNSHSKRATRGYVEEACGILSLIQGAKCDKPEMTDIKFRKHEQLKQTLDNELEEVKRHFKRLYQDLNQCLSEGVDQAEMSCVKMAMEKVITTKDGRGFHKTLRAVCKNDGFYRSTNGVTTDLNHCLATSIYQHIDPKFEEMFPVNKDKTGQSVSETIENFSIISSSMEKFENSPLCLNLTFLNTAETKLKENLQQDILEKKKIIYASLHDSIQTTMLPCYKEAVTIVGKKSLSRMQDLLEKHIESSKSTMFSKAKRDMLELFGNLTEYIEMELKTKLEESMKHSLIIPNSLPLPDVSNLLESMKNIPSMVLD